MGLEPASVRVSDEERRSRLPPGRLLLARRGNGDPLLLPTHETLFDQLADRACVVARPFSGPAGARGGGTVVPGEFRVRRYWVYP